MRRNLQSYCDRPASERVLSDERRADERIDYRDSFLRVYLSSGPFLVVEYFIECNLTMVASGLVFPLGFLIFWAFYYTFYQPNFLEARLFCPERTSSGSVLGILLGVAIWFVKVSLADLIRILRCIFIFGRRPIGAGLRKAVLIETPLPDEIRLALRDLGLAPTVRWEVIQHRYRMLAKRYHPDLNPEITRSGTRFMRLDAAYRRLAHARHRYFVSK